MRRWALVLPIVALAGSAAQDGRPDAASCIATTPNGRAPAGVPAALSPHGNRRLAVLIPRSGGYTDEDGDGSVSTKTIWVARGVRGALSVRYRRVDVPSAWRTARTLPGTLAGFSGRSWASRMHYTVGCWRVSGRVGEVTVGFIVKVEGA